ncbi:MAG: hypothetical protein VW268_03230 [Rhodospirillaceae bacterium]
MSKLLLGAADGTPDVRRGMLLHPLSQAMQVGLAGGIESEEAAKAIVEQICVGVLNA